MKKGSSMNQASVPPSAAELEQAWDTLSLEVTSAGYRSKQPTPHDENPLRHDTLNLEQTNQPRDRLPTLREVDPLRYDLEP